MDSKKENSKKELSPFIGIVAIAIISLGAWYIVYQQPKTQNEQNQVACPQDAKLCPDGSYVARLGPKCEFEVCPAIIAPVWKTYTNSQYNFSFQYPDKFDTQFTSFQEVPAVFIDKPGSDTISKDGCWISDDNESTNTEIAIINDMRFCLSEYEGVGAGQLYKSYYYTTFKDTDFFTIVFLVHTSNGCGAYADSLQFQQCQDFMEDYDKIVLKPIQESVNSFKFSK